MKNVKIGTVWSNPSFHKGDLVQAVLEFDKEKFGTGIVKDFKRAKKPYLFLYEVYWTKAQKIMSFRESWLDSLSKE